jgi:hypothetical protein
MKAALSWFVMTIRPGWLVSAIEGLHLLALLVPRSDMTWHVS